MFGTGREARLSGEDDLRLLGTTRSAGHAGSDEPDAALLTRDFDAREATLLELMRYPMSGRGCDLGEPREFAQRDPLTTRT